MVKQQRRRVLRHEARGRALGVLQAAQIEQVQLARQVSRQRGEGGEQLRGGRRAGGLGRWQHHDGVEQLARRQRHRHGVEASRGRGRLQEEEEQRERGLKIP